MTLQEIERPDVAAPTAGRGTAEDVPRRDTAPARPLVLRNLDALPGWLVVAGFLATTAYLAWALHTDGPEPGFPPEMQRGALIAFWIAGCIGVGHLYRLPCTWLQVPLGGEVVLIRVWPLWVRRDRFPRAAIAGIAVCQGEDSEGDPYFRTRLVLATGEEITVQEGHREAAQQAIAARLRRAINVGAAPPRLDATRPRG